MAPPRGPPPPVRAPSSIQDSNWAKDLTICNAYPASAGSNVITRIIFVGFSLILKRRGILPSKYFTKRHITDTNKKFCLTASYPSSKRLVEKLIAAGEAVKMGYLDEICLVITDRELQVEAIEAHSFRFEYFTDGRVSARLSSTVGGSSGSNRPTTSAAATAPRSTSQQVISLVKSLHNLCEKQLNPLPARFVANFRVKYTTMAPKTFRIEGFHDCQFFYSLPVEARMVGVGSVHTKNHKVTLNCGSLFLKDEEEDEVFGVCHLAAHQENLDHEHVERPRSSIQQRSSNVAHQERPRSSHQARPTSSLLERPRSSHQQRSSNISHQEVPLRTTSNGELSPLSAPSTRRSSNRTLPMQSTQRPSERTLSPMDIDDEEEV